MELGIIGLPTSGKTTIFNALTRGDRPTMAASTGKLEIHTAVIDVPDQRLDRLEEICNPPKKTYTKVAYTDIAGLDKGIAKSGLSGELRNQIARMDAFVHVVRAFKDNRAPHPLGDVDPQRDLNILNDELLLADLIRVENRLEHIAEALEKGARGEERKALHSQQALFERLRQALESGMPLRDAGLTSEEEASVRGFSLLTLKPMLILVNIADIDNQGETPNASVDIDYESQSTLIMPIQGKLEMEIAQLSPDDAEIFMEEFNIQELSLNKVIRTSYQLLNLISFFTVNEDELRAWTVQRGATALEAAGTIHTDLARGFIRAEVIAYDDLNECGSMAAARKAGKVNLEGKEYIVQDGDIIQVRFSV
jgi:hypothetical protein